MPKDMREPRKNYIGVLHDDIEEPRMAGDRGIAGGRAVRQYLRGLMAAMFSRRIEER